VLLLGTDRPGGNDDRVSEDAPCTDRAAFPLLASSRLKRGQCRLDDSDHFRRDPAEHRWVLIRAFDRGAKAALSWWCCDNTVQTDTVSRRRKARGRCEALTKETLIFECFFVRYRFGIGCDAYGTRTGGRLAAVMRDADSRISR
jgi:hypothetical protein